MCSFVSDSWPTRSSFTLFSILHNRILQKIHCIGHSLELLEAMSLTNQVCWVVGGVGVIGRGITRSLLKAGAIVVVNSRNDRRLEKLSEEIDSDHAEKLVCIKGSLLPGSKQASETVHQTLSALGERAINHVVAHGAVRYWTKPRDGGYDETFSLLDSRRLFDFRHDDFAVGAGHLAGLHFSAAQHLVPRIADGQNRRTGPASYTFVTGDGGGHVSTKRSAMGEINAHHIWGLASAMRNEPSLSHIVNREIRIGLPINRPEEERLKDPRERPLSQDIGDLCAGLCAQTYQDSNQLLCVNKPTDLDELLEQYQAKDAPNQQSAQQAL